MNCSMTKQLPSLLKGNPQPDLDLDLNSRGHVQRRQRKPAITMNYQNNQIEAEIHVAEVTPKSLQTIAVPPYSAP